MPNTGYDWSTWDFVTYSTGSDIDGVAVNDDAGLTSDAIDCDGLVSVAFGILAVEDNTGSISGNVTVCILGEVARDVYEEIAGLAGAQVGSPYKFSFTPIQNDTVPIRFSISVKDWHKIKIALLNESGQQLAFDVQMESTNVPVAS